jgi:hypothetical protein
MKSNIVRLISLIAIASALAGCAVYAEPPRAAYYAPPVVVYHGGWR